jgi:hypothetical protein
MKIKKRYKKEFNKTKLLESCFGKGDIVFKIPKSKRMLLFFISQRELFNLIFKKCCIDKSWMEFINFQYKKGYVYLSYTFNLDKHFLSNTLLSHIFDNSSGKFLFSEMQFIRDLQKERKIIC